MKTRRVIGSLVVLAAALWLVPAGGAEGQAPTPLVPPGAGRVPDFELVPEFDRDGNGWLNRDERTAARPRLAELRAGRGRGGRGGGAAAPVEPGPRVSPQSVPSYPGVPLYDQSRLRTVFLEFEQPDWEEEMEAFHRTDVRLPATMRVDGRTYANVGVNFRGNSSFSTVARGRKRSMGISLDHANANQRLEGQRAMTLLNAHSDPTFLRSVLYLDIARRYVPTLQANFMRVVINGESWGIYINQQRFNTDFLQAAFGTEGGVRIKSSNRSRGGSFAYLGDDVNIYRRWYEIESADRDEAWRPLMRVTRVLAETPADRLPAAIEPLMHVDSVLRYLALDIIMQSGDSYFLFGSDYNIYIDPKGVLQLVHHDANEAFTAQASGGAGSAPDARIDPLGYTDDPFKALRHKLLAVPQYRERYLRHVRDIARDALNWAVVEKKIEAWRALIRADVEADTHKLYSTADFTAAVYGQGEARPPATTLKGFILERREYLLSHPEIAKLR
jgi:hypothetical protein